jgi:hypothetical protein
MFHASIGRFIGLDRKSEIEETAEHRQRANLSADIVLYIPGGPLIIRAAFSEELPTAGLLGMNGFFEHFKVTFDPTGKHCGLDRIFQT